MKETRESHLVKKKKVIIKYKSHSSLNTGGEKVFNFVKFKLKDRYFMTHY